MEKVITIKSPDSWNWADVKEIIVGKNVDWFWSDIEIEFNNWDTEWYSLKNNWK